MLILQLQYPLAYLKLSQILTRPIHVVLSPGIALIVDREQEESRTQIVDARIFLVEWLLWALCAIRYNR